MTVKYIGQYSSVVVPLPLGGEVEVPHNGTLETTDEHGRALVLQVNNWKRVRS